MGTRSDNIWNCQAAKENKDMALDSCTRSNRIPDFLATKTVLGLASGHSGKTARKVFGVFFFFPLEKNLLYLFKNGLDFHTCLQTFSRTQK